MKKVRIAELVEKYSQEKVAKMVGCHQTNLSLAIKKGREIYAIINDSDEIVKCYEVKPFPSQQKSPNCANS